MVRLRLIHTEGNDPIGDQATKNCINARTQNKNTLVSERIRHVALHFGDSNSLRLQVPRPFRNGLLQKRDGNERS